MKVVHPTQQQDFFSQPHFVRYSGRVRQMTSLALDPMEGVPCYGIPKQSVDLPSSGESHNSMQAGFITESAASILKLLF